MSDWAMSTAVAFIIFNRPDTTERVFSEISKARPPKLLVVADGPREGKPGEYEKCAATRAIIDRVDWDCEVLTNFSDKNLGCKVRVATGLDWVFEQVEEAIILEDDCIPHPSFFRFCEELLIRYRDDERIGMISGDNFQLNREICKDSYYFSRYMHIWGWASWRRAWKHYDRDVSEWPRIKDQGRLKASFDRRREFKFWAKALDGVYSGRIDTWDYQWALALWMQSMVTIIPCVNLISNIGFGPDATHTVGVSKSANLAVEAIYFPLRHPKDVMIDKSADNFTFRNFVRQNYLMYFIGKLHALVVRTCIRKLKR
jgi:hypothetical protein